MAPAVCDTKRGVWAGREHQERSRGLELMLLGCVARKANPGATDSQVYRYREVVLAVVLPSTGTERYPVGSGTPMAFLSFCPVVLGSS